MSDRASREWLAKALDEARRVEKEMISRDRAEDDARLDALTDRLRGALQRRTGSAADGAEA